MIRQTFEEMQTKLDKTLLTWHENRWAEIFSLFFFYSSYTDAEAHNKAICQPNTKDIFILIVSYGFYAWLKLLNVQAFLEFNGLRAVSRG